MAHVALDFSRITVPELIDLAAHLQAGLTENPHFPQPEPPVTQLEEALGKLGALQEEYRAARLKLNDIKTKRDHLADALIAVVLRGAAYVQETSDGDVKKILSANLHVESEVHLWPYRGLGQVHELHASAGDSEGEVDLSWDPVRGADGYEVESTVDLGGEGEWIQCAATTASRTTIGQLEGSIRYWFKVRAINGHGHGKWSDAVTKYAR